MASSTNSGAGVGTGAGAGTGTRPLAFGPAERARILVLALGVPLIFSVAGVLLMLSFLPELPDPVSIHWGAGGGPDGFGSALVITLVFPAIAFSFGALSTLGLLRMRAVSTGTWTPRALVATVIWFAAFLTVTAVGSLAIQRGITDAAHVGEIWPVLLAALGLSLIVAVPGWLLAPRPALVDAEESTSPALDLAAEERAVWLRGIAPAPIVWGVIVAATVLVLGGAVIALTLGTPAHLGLLIVPTLLIALAVTTLYWRVRVDGAGLTVQSVVGLPRFHYPIAEITEAKVVELSPFGEFGGWGLRTGANRRFGIIMRGGAALEVYRSNGRSVVVTVEDAATAAALINGLVRRGVHPAA